MDDEETPVKTLLDFKLERKIHLKDEERKGLLHRVVIISKMLHNNFAEIGQHYDRLFKEILAKHQTEPITGLLLLYPKHSVHVLESSPEMLLDALRDLQKDSDTGEGHMEKSKVVVVSHDVPQRLYQQWMYRVLDIEAPNLDEYEPSDETEGLVTDMLLQLLKLGGYISKQPTSKMGMKNTMESLHEKVPELLPQQDVIGYLLENDEEVTIPVREHLDKYEKPYDITLANEMVWPMPVRLFPYN